MNYIVVDCDLVDVLIGLTDSESLQASLDILGQFVVFKSNRKQVKIGLKPERDNLEDYNELKGDEVFSTKASLTEEYLQAESDSKDTLVVSLAKDAAEYLFSVNDVKSDELKKDAIEEKITHLDGHFCNEIWHILAELDILA